MCSYANSVLFCLAVSDADDAKDGMNDDGDETPGMLHVASVLCVCCCVLTVS